MSILPYIESQSSLAWPVTVARWPASLGRNLLPLLCPPYPGIHLPPANPSRTSFALSQANENLTPQLHLNLNGLCFSLHSDSELQAQPQPQPQYPFRAADSWPTRRLRLVSLAQNQQRKLRFICSNLSPSLSTSNCLPCRISLLGTSPVPY